MTDELTRLLSDLSIRARIFSFPDETFKGWAEGCCSDEVAIIDGLENMLMSDSCEQTLEQLRPRITLVRERGARVMLLSRAPLQRYPTLRSSSILLDASGYSFRPLSAKQTADYVRSRGIGDIKAMQRLSDFASGSRALLECFCNIELSDAAGNAKLREASSSERIIALNCFQELGPSLCAWLEHWVFENASTVMESDDISEARLQALRLAGVVRPQDSGNDMLALLPMKNREQWVDALGEALELTTSPPIEWRRLVEQLFTLERDLRYFLRKELERIHGKYWATKILPAQEDQISALARRDTAPRVRKYSDIRSPLEWLTLNELLQLAEQQAVTSASMVLGHGPEDWAELSRRVVPIRNRVAHMRLAREGDWQEIRNLRRMVAMRMRQASKSSED